MDEAKIRELPVMREFLETWGRHCGAPLSVFTGHVEVLARKLLEAQREEDAKVCEELATAIKGSDLGVTLVMDYLGAYLQCAAAIRAGEKP